MIRSPLIAGLAVAVAIAGCGGSAHRASLTLTPQRADHVQRLCDRAAQRLRHIRPPRDARDPRKALHAAASTVARVAHVLGDLEASVSAMRGATAADNPVIARYAHALRDQARWTRRVAAALRHRQLHRARDLQARVVLASVATRRRATEAGLSGCGAVAGTQSHQ